MRTSHRTERVSDALLQEISRAVLRVVKDPRIEGITITGVKVSKDLRNARAYYSVLGDTQRQRDALEGLRSAKGVIKREVGRNLSLRFMPEIEFIFDDSLAYAEHIQNLLNTIEKPES